MTTQHALLEALEPRILYSADLAAVLGSAVGSEQSAAHVQLLQAPEQTASKHEIVFIDLGLPQAQSLVAGLQKEMGKP